MILDRLLFLSDEDHRPATRFLRAVEKFLFVIYIGANLYNGVIFDALNHYLEPTETGKPWYCFWKGSGSLENRLKCNGFIKVFTNHMCINHMFILEEDEIHKVICNMTSFQKWRFLIITRFLKTLAPYVLQISMFMMFIWGLYFVYTQLMLLLSACGIPLCEVPSLAALKRQIHSTISSLITIHHLATIIGVLITSNVLCFVTPCATEGICKDTLSLYCVSGLAKTVFRNPPESQYAISSELKFSLMYPAAKLISVCILTVLLWFLTMFFICFIMYFIMDTFDNLKIAGNVVMENVPHFCFIVASPGGLQRALNSFTPPDRLLRNYFKRQS